MLVRRGVAVHVASLFCDWPGVLMQLLIPLCPFQPCGGYSSDGGGGGVFVGGDGSGGRSVQRRRRTAQPLGAFATAGVGGLRRRRRGRRPPRQVGADAAQRGRRGHHAAPPRHQGEVQHRHQGGRARRIVSRWRKRLRFDRFFLSSSVSLLFHRYPHHTQHLVLMKIY